MTRNGKIARLPSAIRQQLNLRLQNGELNQDLLSQPSPGTPGQEKKERLRQILGIVQSQPRRRPGTPLSTETRTQLN